MLWTIIIVGGIWFWLLTLVFGVVSTYFVYDEEPQRTGIAFVIYLVLLQFFSDVNLWTWTLEHWRRALLGIAVYLVLGLVWAVLNFGAYLRERADGYVDLRVEFLRSQGVQDATGKTRVPDHLRHHWRARITRDFPTDARGHKKEIIAWMTVWPLSLLLAFINNPLRGGALWVYNRTSWLFDLMAHRAAKRVGLYDDTAAPPVPSAPASAPSGPDRPITTV